MEDFVFLLYNYILAYRPQLERPEVKIEHVIYALKYSKVTQLYTLFHTNPNQFWKNMLIVTFMLRGYSFEDAVEEVSKLSIVDINYVYSIETAIDDCDYCGGDGKVDCDYCDGTGEEECDTCQGSGMDTCMECLGDGEGDEEGENCEECNGEGNVECSDCSGSGKDSCSYCMGDGSGECEECGGEGETELEGQTKISYREITFAVNVPLFEKLLGNELKIGKITNISNILKKYGGDEIIDLNSNFDDEIVLDAELIEKNLEEEQVLSMDITPLS